MIKEHVAGKQNAKWSKYDKNNILKDAKVQNILFNSHDSVHTNDDLIRKSAKQMRDKLQDHGKGPKPVKKNMRSLLLQEYKYFEAKSWEILTKIYDRFTKLVNDMIMHVIYYENKDLKIKFMRAPPDMQGEKSTALREANYLGKILLEALYGKL